MKELESKNFKILSVVASGFWLFLLGLTLRFVSLFSWQGLTLDEMVSVHFAQIPLAQSFFRDNSAPLFSFLLRNWLQALPQDEMSVRVLPFIISAIALFYVFKRFKDFWVRTLFVISPASISLAGEVKNSSLFYLMSVLFIGEILILVPKLKIQKKIPVNDWIWPGMAAIGLVASHYLGLLLLLSAVIFVGVNQEIELKFRKIAWSLALVVAVVMIGINYYWLHSPALIWMQEIHKNNYSLIFLLPLYVLGSYSRSWAAVIFCFILGDCKKKKSSTALWFMILIALYFLVEMWTDRSLGFRRFLIPLDILSTLVVAGYYAQIRGSRKWLTLILVGGLLLQSKKIVEDFFELRSGWKEAASAFCGQNLTGPKYVYAHEALKYYFSENCAHITSQCQDDLANQTIWLVQKQTEQQFLTTMNQCKPLASLQIQQVIVEKSYEPILVYERIQNDH